MSELTHRARELRKRQTEAEKVFWEYTRNRKTGYKVVRQKPLRFYVGDKQKYFIADFYCQELGLAIEIDGKIHEDQKEYDQVRDAVIKHMKIKVIRIKNEELLDNAEQLVKKIFTTNNS